MDVRKSDEVVSKIADILTTIIHTALEEECRRRRMKSFTNMLFFDWRFPKPAYTKIKDVLPHYSRQIIERLDPKWRDTRVYCELEAEAAKPPRPLEPLTDQDILKFLVPRKKLYQETQSVPKKKPERKQSPSETATGGQGSKVGEKRPRSRPRTAGKTATLRPAAPVAERAAESDESEDEDSWLEEYRQGPPAKKSALEGPHNASSSPARRLQDDDDASDADSSSDSSSIVDLGIDDNDPDLADAVGDPGSTASVSTMRLVVRAERLPNTEPQGPNGTWVCEYCGHVVRDAARDRRQQELVRQHLRDHEDQEEKISLAVSEGMAGGVNVSYVSVYRFRHRHHVAC